MFWYCCPSGSAEVTLFVVFLGSVLDYLSWFESLIRELRMAFIHLHLS